MTTETTPAGAVDIEDPSFESAAPAPGAPPAEQFLPVAAHPATGVVSFDAAQMDVLRSIVGSDFSDAEFDFFLAQCRRTNLDPFSKQIYAWKSQGKVVTMTSIDGLRLIARRTGKYAGRTSVEWMTADGAWVEVWVASLHGEYPAAARVVVVNRDDDFPTTSVASWDEFKMTKKDGSLSVMWETKPAHMLAKVAEALALRAAFPNDLSGIYTDDEIETARGLSSEAAPDPGAEPGRGDKVVEDAMLKFLALPDDARAAIDSWWLTKYVGTVLRSGGWPSITDGALYRFRGNSAHARKVAELIDRAVAKTKTEPSPVDPPAAASDSAPAADDADVPADTAEPSDPAPAAEEVFTDDEFAVLDVIRSAVGSGGLTSAGIAERMGMEPSAPLRALIQTMAARELIGLPPGPKRKHGEAPVYVVNEDRVAVIESEFELRRNQL